MLLNEYLSIRYMFGAPLIQDHEIKSMYLTDYSKTEEQSEREGRKLLRALDRLVPLIKLNKEITTVRLSCRDTGSGLRYNVVLRNNITGETLFFTPYQKTKTQERYDNGSKKYVFYAYLTRYENSKYVNVWEHPDSLSLKELLDYIREAIIINQLSVDNE